MAQVFTGTTNFQKLGQDVSVSGDYALITRQSTSSTIPKVFTAYKYDNVTETWNPFQNISGVVRQPCVATISGEYILSFWTNGSSTSGIQINKFNGSSWLVDVSTINFTATTGLYGNEDKTSQNKFSVKDDRAIIFVPNLKLSGETISPRGTLFILERNGSTWSVVYSEALPSSIYLIVGKNPDIYENKAVVNYVKADGTTYGFITYGRSNSGQWSKINTKESHFYEIPATINYFIGSILSLEGNLLLTNNAKEYILAEWDNDYNGWYTKYPLSNVIYDKTSNPLDVIQVNSGFSDAVLSGSNYLLSHYSFNSAAGRMVLINENGWDYVIKDGDQPLARYSERMAFDGNTLIVTAKEYDTGVLNSAGRVYFWKYTEKTTFPRLTYKQGTKVEGGTVELAGSTSIADLEVYPGVGIFGQVDLFGITPPIPTVNFYNLEGGANVYGQIKIDRIDGQVYGTGGFIYLNGAIADPSPKPLFETSGTITTDGTIELTLNPLFNTSGFVTTDGIATLTQSIDFVTDGFALVSGTVDAIPKPLFETSGLLVTDGVSTLLQSPRFDGSGGVVLTDTIADPYTEINISATGTALSNGTVEPYIEISLDTSGLVEVDGESVIYGSITYYSEGGAVISGDVEYPYVETELVVSGTVLTDGLASFIPKPVFNTSGAIITNGTIADPFIEASFNTSGTVLTDGIASFIPKPLLEASGTVVAGGLASFIPKPLLEASGTVVAGGALSPFIHLRPFRSTGGVLFNGTASFIPKPLFETSGEVIIGGTIADPFIEASFNTSGTILVDGIASFIPKPLLEASGTVLTDGLASFIPKPLFETSGTVLTDGLASFIPKPLFNTSGTILVDGDVEYPYVETELVISGTILADGDVEYPYVETELVISGTILADGTADPFIEASFNTSGTITTNGTASLQLDFIQTMFGNEFYGNTYY